MNKIDVVLGMQWGDEGKGKVVDVLTPRYEAVARFQGGPNAGHTLIFGDEKYVLHTIPSGIFRDGSVNIIGNGVVVDPVIFAREIATLEEAGIEVRSKLRVSKRAHLILPTHRMLDAASEASKGASKIGSTLKGIGPTYMDKTGRNGLRVGDIISPQFEARYGALKAKHEGLLAGYKDFAYDIAEYEREWMEGIEVLRSLKLIESEIEANRMLDRGVKMLAEGAQGSMLDVDFGTYPFVTSSTTLCAGVCTGLGVAPHRIGEVYGIFKAYCTRVGSGPFPTELFDADGQRMAEVGMEFGSTTGRARRCGWLDMVALKYAVVMNGATKLIMMKGDVLSGFETIKVCTGYRVAGEVIDYFPFETNEAIEPVYEEFPGWKVVIGGVRRYEDFPVEFRAYVEFIERATGVPVEIISVGPDREETVVRDL
ncbi:MAG: adenylosuccinate synthase [Alistipes sp.]|jgi:adenylosuccinate synthase|nr:adenylosuccinate synthase [Alistipes sp.]